MAGHTLNLSSVKRCRKSAIEQCHQFIRKILLSVQFSKSSQAISNEHQYSSYFWSLGKLKLGAWHGVQPTSHSVGQEHIALRIVIRVLYNPCYKTTKIHPEHMVEHGRMEKQLNRVFITEWRLGLLSFKWVKTTTYLDVVIRTWLVSPPELRTQW